MGRKTLTEWPKADEPVPRGRYAFLTPIVGEFDLDGDASAVLFRSKGGAVWTQDDFDDGDLFVPDPDPQAARLSALEAENAGLREAAEANADAASEHAAISTMMAADPVLCRYGVLEAFEMLKARADEACGEDE